MVSGFGYVKNNTEITKQIFSAYSVVMKNERAKVAWLKFRAVQLT